MSDGEDAMWLRRFDARWMYRRISESMIERLEGGS